LISEIERLIESGRIVFSSGLGGPRGQTWHNLFGMRRVYVKVIEMNHGRYLHQLPWQLSESLFHEAVHSLQTGAHRASFEEECDAFVAGLQAEAVSRGIAPASVFRMDGLPVAEFVKRSYPNIGSNTRYSPVGESLEWLLRRAGCTQGPAQEDLDETMRYLEEQKRKNEDVRAQLAVLVERQRQIGEELARNTNAPISDEEWLRRHREKVGDTDGDERQ